MMKTRLDRRLQTPLYRQLADLLREDLEKKPPGQRFYGDDELCQMFKISQPVARMALKILVDEGLLHRIRARGTYVQAPLKKSNGGDGWQRLVVVAPLGSFFPHAKALRAIQQTAEEEKYELLLKEHPGPYYQRHVMETLVQELLNTAEGVIWISPHTEEIADLPNLTEPQQQRLVLINLAAMVPGLSCVSGDYYGGAYRMTAYLLQQGYRQIAYIGASRQRQFAKLRWAGFQAAMMQAGRLPQPELCIPFSEAIVPETVLPEAINIMNQEGEQDYQHRTSEIGYQIMAAILAAGHQPDAVFAVTDSTALGAMQKLQEAGISIPATTAVAGFDDAPWAQQIKPSLTTMRLPYAEMGRKAAAWLIRQIRHREPAGGLLLVPCPLLVRHSTR